MTVIGKLEPASVPDHVNVYEEAKLLRPIAKAIHHPV